MKLQNKDGGGDNGATDKPLDITIDMLGDSNHQDNTDHRSQQQKDADAEKQRIADEEKAKQDKDAANADTNNKKDDEALKAKALELGGTSFDGEGNLLDSTGKLVKTKDEVEKALDAEQEFTFTENDNGDILDETGKVVIKKADVKRDKDGNVLIPDSIINPPTKGTLVEELAKFTGIKVADKDGNLVQYDDTEEGIANYVKDAVNIGINQGALKLFEAMPDVKDYYLHRTNGGSASDFFKETTDWSKVVFDKSWTPEQKIDWVVKDLTAKGVDADEAKALAQVAKDSNKLDERTEKAIANLKELDKAKSKQRQDEYNAKQAEQIKETQNYWNGIKSVVDKGELEGIAIPEKDRKAFFDYISKPVDKQGRTQEMIDTEKEVPEKGLKLSYLRFKKFDLKELVQREAQTQNAKGLRERIAKAKNNTSGAKITVVKKGDANYVPSINDVA